MPLARPVSEHLARCLEPHLPAGVHQTALEVYDSVFSTLGPNQLYRDMNIWLPGLLPLMSNAAFSVKPLVIELFSKHIITCPSLRELCRPLLLACLPSIENESSECFTDIMDLLQTLRDRLNDDTLFWQCLMLCAITSSESRLGVLAYCQRELPSFSAQGPDNQLCADARLVVSPEPRNFLRALIQGLRDSNILVQRGFLDILVKNCPLDSPLFSSCSSEDLKNLVHEASRIILRRDMSLNRRLWSWLLGPSQDAHADKDQNLKRIDYFRKYGAEAIVQVLLLNMDTGDIVHLNETFAIAHGIMDRWEIGSVVVPRLLPTVLNQAKKYRHEEKALQGAKQLFNAIESNHIWKTALEMVRAGDVDTPLFMISSFDIREEEMMLVHLPLFLMATIDLKTKIDSSLGWTQLVEKLLELISQASLARFDPKAPKPSNVEEIISAYYEKSVLANESEEDVDLANPFDAETLTVFVVRSLAENFVADTSSANASLLQLILTKIPPLDDRIEAVIETLLTSEVYDASLFVQLHATMRPVEVVKYVDSFVQRCYDLFSASGPGVIEFIRDLGVIHGVCNEYLVPSALAACFSRHADDPVGSAKALSVLWIHSGDRNEFLQLLAKPTLLFLDMLLSSDSNAESVGKLYLRRAVIQTGTIDRLLKLILDLLKQHASDSDVFEYHLKIVSQLLTFPEIRAVYDLKFSMDTMEYFYQWVSQNSADVDSGAYSAVLSLVSGTYLRSSQEASTAKLRTLVDFAVLLMSVEKKQLNHSIINFVSDSLPLLPFEKNVTFGNVESLAYKVFVFLQTTISWVTSDIDFVALSRLLDQFLTVFHPFISQVLLPVTAEIIGRLTELEERLLSGSSYSINDSESIVQLMTSLEKVLITGLQLLYPTEQSFKDDVSDPGSGPTANILGSVISGVFSVESPADRSSLESGRVMLFEAIDLTMQKCCRYWCFLDSVRQITMRENQYSSALHATSRLKTRLRKLTSLLYRRRPVETIKLAAVYCETPVTAVKMVHNFEGTLFRESVQVIIGQINRRFDSKQSEVGDLLDNKIGDHEFMDFFICYVKSLESDVVEDIWPTLLGFLNDVNSKSSHYSKILLSVLYLCVVMADTISNDKVNPRRKLQKDFADVFQKLLLSTLSDVPLSNLVPEKTADSFTLVSILPHISKILTDQDRQATVLTKILNSTVVPSLKSNELSSISNSVFDLLGLIIEHSPQAKVWKSVVSDFLFDTKLFTLTVEQAILLMPVVDKYVQVDKERLSEFLSRLENYGSNSVLFGWSGSQKLSKENLNRLAYIMMSCENIPVNWPKLVNQLSAIWNSGSVANVCTLLRACIFRQDRSQLSAVYSFMNFKLQEIFSDLLSALESSKAKEKDLRDPAAVEQLAEAAKLLDLLLTLNSDQVQVYEWVFICDNTDAIYPHDENRSGDIVDKLAVTPGLKRLDPVTVSGLGESRTEFSLGQLRRPLLQPESTIHDLHLFFSQLSISFYESIYGLSEVDEIYCRQLILSDVFV